MTLLRALRSSPEDPKVPLSDASLATWLTGGTSDAGVAVTEQRVLGLPAFYRALAVTAGTLGSLPVHVYKTGTSEKLNRPTVLDKPNPRQTAIEWKTTSKLHALAWGNAFDRKVRNGAGEVKEVWPMHPSRVRIETVDPTSADPAGKLFLVRQKNGQELQLTSRDVLHRPFMSMDGVSGLRPLEIFRQSLGIAIAGDTSAAKFYGNNQMPPGILTVKEQLPDQTAADRIKTRWKQAVGGMENRGEIAVLDNGATFTPVAVPPEDAQLLQSRQWAVTEIIRMIGPPPHLAGDLEKTTSWGTGIEQQVLGWVKFTLQAWITSDEQRFDSELLPPGAYSKTALEGLLRGDSAARSAFYHSGITDGWLTRNEVRDLEDRERVEGLDEFIVPSNMTLISVDGSIVPLSSAGASAADATTSA